jgi:hypothetical protein
VGALSEQEFETLPATLQRKVSSIYPTDEYGVQILRIGLIFRRPMPWQLFFGPIFPLPRRSQPLVRANHGRRRVLSSTLPLEALNAKNGLSIVREAASTEPMRGTEYLFIDDAWPLLVWI